MADGLWNIQQQMLLSSGVLKRQRSDYDLPLSREPSGYEMQNHLARDNYHVGPQVLKDTKTIDSAYDRYLQNQVPSRTSGEPSTYGGVGLGRDTGGGTPGLSLEDQGLMSRPRAVPDLTPIRGSGFGSQLPVDVMPRPGRETLPLPPDASNTIYVEGLPSNCTKREVAHIFRPFVGYKEVRLVSKESKHRGGDPLILCFVDFVNAACAATAMSALQGYKMDEHDPDSAYLRLQFSRHPGPRSSSGSRGKR